MFHSYKVTSLVGVKLDESKFTPEFLADYARGLSPSVTTIDHHRSHLAELFATGYIQGNKREELEGYGCLGDMGIEFTNYGTDVESDEEED